MVAAGVSWRCRCWLVAATAIVLWVMPGCIEPARRISSGSRWWKRRGRCCWQWATTPTARRRCPAMDGNGSPVTPVPSSDSSQTVPFADTVTIARVVGALEARKKQVVIRRGSSSSFSDLRGGAVVLIGAFNNEWSLRLTRQLRYSLAMDPDRHLIYIRDAKNPLRAAGAGAPISHGNR